MAYAAAVTFIGGRREPSGALLLTWKVAETDTILANGTTAWNIPGVPVPCELALFEAQLVTAGGAATIQPELGIATGWTDDTLDEVAQASAAAAHVRIAEDTPIVSHTAGAREVTLYGRSIPNTNTDATGVIHSYVTVRVGAQ